jgi:hypothetical protein
MFFRYTLEKIEQYRDIGSFRHTRHRTKRKKAKNTEKKKATRTPQKPGVTQVFAKTPAVLLMYTVKSGKSLGSDRGKKTPT